MPAAAVMFPSPTLPKRPPPRSLHRLGRRDAAPQRAPAPSDGQPGAGRDNNWPDFTSHAYTKIRIQKAPQFGVPLSFDPGPTTNLYCSTIARALIRPMNQLNLLNILDQRILVRNTSFVGNRSSFRVSVQGQANRELQNRHCSCNRPNAIEQCNDGPLNFTKSVIETGNAVLRQSGGAKCFVSRASSQRIGRTLR